MNNYQELLRAIYNIVKDVPQPTQYHCTTRELMLRLNGDWSMEQLEDLNREGCIELKKSGLSVAILLTEKGLEKAKQFEVTSTGNDEKS